MANYRHCRFCDSYSDDDSLVKYGVRHYAHAVCLFKHRGIEALAALHAWQIRQLPVIALVRVGFADAGTACDRLEAMAAAAESRFKVQKEGP